VSVIKWFPSSGEIREEIIIQMSSRKAKAEKGTVPIRTYAAYCPIANSSVAQIFIINY
jgi:hypothetical protein